MSSFHLKDSFSNCDPFIYGAHRLDDSVSNAVNKWKIRAQSRVPYETKCVWICFVVIFLGSFYVKTKPDRDSGREILSRVLIDSGAGE